MESSDVARFVMKQYIDSLDAEENSHSSDNPYLAKFKAIRDKLKAAGPALFSPKHNSNLSDLNHTLTEWRILEEQNKKSIKKVFSCLDRVARMGELSDLHTRLCSIESELLAEDSSSIATQSRLPNFPLSDSNPSYKPHRFPSAVYKFSDELEKKITDWLLTSGDDFKAVGICGMGGSGKTALLKNVLEQKAVTDKFKQRIIWAPLSDLMTCEEEETDVRIVQFLLHGLGLDADGVAGNVDENKDRLMEELVRVLRRSENYVLVLDDMWHCSQWFADRFLGKLKKMRGGAVIVTSRRKTVAQKFGGMNSLVHLNPSTYKESAFLKIQLKPSTSKPVNPSSDD